MGGGGGTEGSGADQVSTAAGGLFWLLFGLLLIRGAPRGTRHREQGAIVVLAVDPAGVRAARVRQRHTGGCDALAGHDLYLAGFRVVRGVRGAFQGIRRGEQDALVGLAVDPVSVGSAQGSAV